MIMKNRIIAFVLVLAMMIPMIVFAGSEDAPATLTYAEEVFAGLGIIDADSYNPYTKITRGEFATLVSKLVLYNNNGSADEWYQNNFEPEQGANVTPESPLFGDVDGSHKHFNGIKTLVNMGYMRGIGGNVFAPDFQMALSEGAKVVVSMLGYDEIASALGGFPTGYTNVASKCKLFSGIGKSYTDVMEMTDAVQLLYNAFDVNVKMALEIYDNELVYKDMGETFLNFFLKLEKAEGRMTDNGITSLGGTSSVGREMLIIDGKKMEYTASSYAYSRYIGREVTAYYSIDKSNENTCVYICPEDDVTVITDGTSFSNGELAYSANGRDYQTKIPRNSVIIYNGVYTDDYTDDLLSVENGTVTLIKGDNGKSIVNVREAVGIYVSNVSYDAQKVYSALKFSSLADGVSVYSLGEGEQYDNVLIFDKNDNAITIEDIVKGDILSICASADAKTVIEVRKLGNAVTEAELDSYTDKEFITKDTVYKFTESYNKATNKATLTPGETYKVYLDENNCIVWIAKGAQSVGKVAIYTGSGSNSANGFEDDYAVRLFTEDKELKVFNLPEKITLNGKRVKAEEVCAELDPFMGKAVIFNANEDTLSSIITPASYGETETKEWYHVSPALNVFRKTGVESFKTLYYEPGDGASFGGNFAYNSSTRLVFTVPTSENEFDNEKRFHINNPLTSSTSYTVEAYSTIKNDPVPEVLIIYADSKGTGKVTRNRGLLITKVINTVDDEGEAVTAFKGYEIKQNSLKEVTVAVDDEAYMTKYETDETLYPLDPEKDTDLEKFGPLTYKDLEPGDIIRYGTDGDGKIATIRIAFDYSQMRGYDESKFVPWASFAGPVLTVNNKGLKLAYGIKPEDIDYTSKDDVLKIMGFAFGGSKYPLVFVENDGRGLSFREGTYEDITSYELTGDSDTCDFACILTHFTGGRMGGVIYVR